MDAIDNIYYTNEHEWLKVEGDAGTVGITDFAQSELGDIVYAELPELSSEFKRDEKFAVIESVKAASEIYLPVSGEIIEINKELEDSPEIINHSPYDAGWIVKIRIKDKSELKKLLSKEEYMRLTSE